MRKDKPLIELARIIAKRSICNVQVGAIIFDSRGVFAWGWNHAGPTGYGQHAEKHAIKRANLDRSDNSYILVLSLRNGKLITSKPCELCQLAINNAGLIPVFYEDKFWRVKTRPILNQNFFRI